MKPPKLITQMKVHPLIQWIVGELRLKGSRRDSEGFTKDSASESKSLPVSSSMAKAMIFGCLTALVLALDAHGAGASPLFVVGWVTLANITLLLSLTVSWVVQFAFKSYFLTGQPPAARWKSAEPRALFRPPQR